MQGVNALINITSDGLLNLTRVEAEVGFEIDRLIEPQPIFALIQRFAGVATSEMYEVYNMGIGFATSSRPPPPTEHCRSCRSTAGRRR